MGRMHSSVYSSLPDVQVVATHASRMEGAEKLAADHGATVVHDLKEILESNDVDVVDICLPTDVHAETAIAALDHGKHVFCEKPMARDSFQATAMIAAAERNNRQLMIGHCIRFWNEYAELERLKKSGELGELLSLNLIRYGEFPSWSIDGWIGDEARSGGAALDMHIHDTDFALHLLGQPDEVFSRGTIDDRGPSQIFTTMRFGKTVVHAEGGWNLPPKTPFKHAFRAIFERGAAIFDGGPLTVFQADGTNFVPVFASMSAGDIGGNLNDLGGYYHELKYFYDCLTTGRPMDRCTPTSALRSLEVTLDEIRQVKEAAQ